MQKQPASPRLSLAASSLSTSVRTAGSFPRGRAHGFPQCLLPSQGHWDSVLISGTFSTGLSSFSVFPTFRGCSLLRFILSVVTPFHFDTKKFSSI